MIHTIYNENLYKRINKMNKIFLHLLFFLQWQTAKVFDSFKNSSENLLTNAITDTYKQLMSAIKTYQDIPMYSTLIKNSFREFASSARAKVLKKLRRRSLNMLSERYSILIKLKTVSSMKLSQRLAKLNFMMNQYGAGMTCFTTQLEKKKIKYNISQCLSTTKKRIWSRLGKNWITD